jgi:hypothetical protein
MDTIHMIPKTHVGCSHCINPDNYYRKDGEPYCKDHKGPDGEPVEYVGCDAYEPSEWVNEIVGSRFTFYDHRHNVGAKRAAVCIGYDPRHGFWMEADTIDGLPPYLTNVSERAINRSYHKLHLSLASHRLLTKIDMLGRLPTPQEVSPICLEIASATLRFGGCLTPGDQITETGRKFLGSDPAQLY